MVLNSEFTNVHLLSERFPLGLFFFGAEICDICWDLMKPIDKSPKLKSDKHES